jgi:hypothetical protein
MPVEPVDEEEHLITLLRRPMVLITMAEDVRWRLRSFSPAKVQHLRLQDTMLAVIETARETGVRKKRFGRYGICRKFTHI